MCENGGFNILTFLRGAESRDGDKGDVCHLQCGGNWLYLENLSVGDMLISCSDR